MDIGLPLEALGETTVCDGESATYVIDDIFGEIDRDHRCHDSTPPPPSGWPPGGTDLTEYGAEIVWSAEIDTTSRIPSLVSSG